MAKEEPKAAEKNEPNPVMAAPAVTPPGKPAPKVYQAICNVMQELAEEGIGKGRKNTQQNYAFRGIDDVYNALCAILWKHKLCMLPRAMERTCEERATKSGGTLFYVTLKVDFDMVSAEDGTMHLVTTYGEAMDSGDKATNKAQSAAYKYAAMMAFCIPTEGTGKDSEEDTYDGVQPSAAGTKAAAKAPAAAAPSNEPVKPPHDPKTGEILPPHTIEVPLTNGVGDPDLWAKIYMAALRASPEKIEEWVRLNATLMGQLSRYSPKSHKAVTAVLDDIRSKPSALPTEVPPSNVMAAG